MIYRNLAEALHGVDERHAYHIDSIVDNFKWVMMSNNLNEQRQVLFTPWLVEKQKKQY